MSYKAEDFGNLIGMEGFSETLLKNHFTLYQGYVNNTNKIHDLLSEKAKDATNPEYAELKRRFGFEFNGMRLHEYYFGNLGGKAPLGKWSILARKLADAYGSYEAWLAVQPVDHRARGWALGWLPSHPGNGCL